MTDSTTPQDAAAMSPASDGSVSVEPVAWSIQWRGENRPDGHWTYADKGTAEICLAGCGVKGVVVPLYRQPTLTDAEREALRKVLRLLREGFFRDSSIELVQAASVIDGLLDRQG